MYSRAAICKHYGWTLATKYQGSQKRSSNLHLSDEGKSIISMHCPEAGVQSSSQSQNKKWLRNDAQIPVSPRVWQKCLLTSSPRSRGWLYPCSSGCLSQGLLQRPPKPAKKRPWLISLSFGTPLNDKPICYSIHSAPESLTFSSSTACQIKTMSLLMPGNFSA